MDYTQFLQKPDEVLRLPYFGGKSVCDDKLTYRLREVLQPGWYQFRKSGRCLTVENEISPELDVWKLPRVVGYVFRERLVTNDSQDRLFGLPMDEDLPKFCPVAGNARRPDQFGAVPSRGGAHQLAPKWPAPGGRPVSGRRPTI